MPNEIDPALRQTITGILPPITTPFDEDGALVFEAIAEQVEFIIAAEATGIIAGGSTGEGHTLGSEVFAAVMSEAHRAIAGRVPFVAGLIVNSTQEAIERVRLLDDLTVDALQVTPVHYLFRPDDDATVEHFRAIWQATGIPLLIYNVIPWNYLGVDLMLRIMDEVPGVIGIKQSSGDLKSLSDLLLRVKPENLVLTGIDALLYPAFTLGAHGAITALTSAVPGTVVKLWRLVEAGDHSAARELHYKLNALWNVLRHDNLPAFTKYIQHRQGLGFYHPRAPMEGISDADREQVDKALAALLS